MQGYCVCSNNIAITTMTQRCRGYGCACGSLCDRASRLASIHIPDNSQCLEGAKSSLDCNARTKAVRQLGIICYSL